MQSPIVFGVLEGGFSANVDGLKFVFLQHFVCNCIQKHEFPHDVGDVYLAGNLLAGLVVHSGAFPVSAEVAQAEEGLKGHQHEVKQVEILRRYLTIPVLTVISWVGVCEELFGETDFEGLFVVLSEQEHESDDGADETSHVGKVGVEGVVAPLDGEGAGRLVEPDFGQRLTALGGVTVAVHPFGHPDHFVRPDVAHEGNDALFSVNGVFLEDYVGTPAQGLGENKEVGVLHVEILVVGRLGVESYVDHT